MTISPLQDIDNESFDVKYGIFCGQNAFLVQPNHIGTKFTQRNKIFRSSIWTLQGELLSAGFPKFVNFGENPDNFPVPTSTKGCSIVSKEDGSLAICDYIDGQFSCRTRGVFSYKTHTNVFDYDDALNKYKVEEICKKFPQQSLLFEFVTNNPDHDIVLKYPENDLFLIGIINKQDYSLFTQSQLNKVAEEFGLKRPKIYNVEKFSLQGLIDFIKESKGIEGICLYSKGDQEIHKIKSEEYLKKHAFKESANIETVLDFYVEQGYPSYSDFYVKMVQEFDYECVQQVQGEISNVCEAYKEVEKIIEGMKKFIDKNTSSDNLSKDERKVFAQKVFQAYGNTNRASFVFTLFDNKELKKDNIKKLLWQVLKK